jgi:shikimate dehydrogenase
MTPRHSPRVFSFIGVSTGQSAIMKVFPQWAEHLGVRDVVVAGIDLPLHADRQAYRDVVERIKAGGAELGGLVTTHKLDLFGACRDQFDYIDRYSEFLAEVSSLSKRDGLLRAHAKDPISAGRSLDQLIPPGHWSATGGMALLFGAGGAGSAISLHLLEGRPPADRPAGITVVDIDPKRVGALRDVHQRIETTVEVRYIENSDPLVNDALLASLPAGSLVVNATGMGKDVPGSPVTDEGIFPEAGLVWELNYRGKLSFLRQAGRQRGDRRLLVEDGWKYFVHGWTCVMEEVLNLAIGNQVRDELCEIALHAYRGEGGNGNDGFFARSTSAG